jgi:cytochrome c oxidase subunit II
MTAPGLACAGLATCGAAQNALDPTGDGAVAIASIWWIFFWTCTVVFLLVLAALAWAMLHGRARPEPIAPEVHPPPAREKRLGAIVASAVAMTIVVLFVFTIFSYLVDRKLFAHSGDGEVNIELVGHQWWWEVRYQDSVPSQSFTTANEIHVPVGALVKLTLDSPDVIHSFWVPNLTGKMDLIPGQQNTTWLTVQQPGVYRGQCAEFCGLQHAHMALFVVAEERQAFESWVARQREPAPDPQSDEAKAGKAVFLSSPCVMCHTIQGTLAGSNTGPDLTHLASRLTLGAGRLPNTRGHLAGWVVDAQTQKPGNAMPPNLVVGEKLQALLAYLETLQ